MNDNVIPDARAGIPVPAEPAGNRSEHRSAAHPGMSWYADTPPGLFVIAFLYLLLPAIGVLFRFQSWAIAAPVLVAAAAALYWLVRYVRTGPAGPFWPSWRSWPFLLVAVCGACMTGVVPPFAQNADWTKHYALFNALATQPWPPAVPTDQGLGTLRYSLGYYVVPSMIAKYAGMQMLGVAIAAWTAAGLYLGLMLAFGARGLSVPARFLLAIVFLLFSGADVVGTGITHAPVTALMHFEWWAGFGQFSSNITSMLWTPQHALSAWLATFLLLRYPQRSVEAGGVLVAAVAIWSPFSAIGIVPVLAWAIYQAGPRHLLTWMNLLVAPVLLVAGAVFLTNGAGGIPASFAWSRSTFSVGTWFWFIVLEFGAIAASLILVAPRNAVLVGVATLSLLALSVSNVGMYSDLMMRGAVPALAILAALAAMAVVTAPNTLRKAPLVVCLVVGLVTPLGEIMRGIAGVRFADPSQYRLTEIISGGGAELAPQYIVPGYTGPLERTTVATLAGTPLIKFGAAAFDDVRHRITLTDFAEGAYITPVMALPAGLYEVDAVASWDVTAGPGADHAAHISLHGQRILFPIPASRATDKKVHFYFRTNGEPFALSFGIGGWALGKGFIEFRQLKVSRVRF